MQNSLRTRLTIFFIGLATVPLLLVGVIIAWRSYVVQQEQALDLQSQVARRVAADVSAFIQERESELRLLIDLRGLPRLDREQQTSLLDGLLAYQDVYEELSLFDSQGQELIRLSRLYTTTPDEPGSRAGADEFERPRASGEVYYSSAQYDPVHGEPFMTIAVPLVDLQSGEFIGVLAANFRFKKVWDLLAEARVEGGGLVYVVDAEGRVIAHKNPTVVLQDARFTLPERDGFYAGLDGTEVALASARIQLGEQAFDIVAELPASEALALAIATVYVASAAILVALAVAGVLSLLAARQIVRPIEALSGTAQAISGGDLGRQVLVGGHDEIGKLAGAFNHMTLQLRDLINNLERRVAERTFDLEQANAEISTLNELLKDENMRMTAELDVTRQLQQMLLPTGEELRQVKGVDIAGFMEPAEEVGGDYYDVLQHNGQLKIGMGDVTGHGLESGVVMLMIQTAVRTLLVSDERDPVRFMDVLNRVLHANMRRMAVDKSLTLALLDYQTGRLCLSGQHEQLIVVRQGGQVELVDTMKLGFPVGLVEEIADFVSEVWVELEPGDGIVLYSDGFTEAQNEAKEFYGLGRLCQVVSEHWASSAEEIKEEVVRDARGFIGQQTVYDDLTLLVVKQK
jgi:serine phosphatase RsbU (regulator of sigma subunit)